MLVKAGTGSTDTACQESACTSWPNAVGPSVSLESVARGSSDIPLMMENGDLEL